MCASVSWSSPDVFVKFYRLGVTAFGCSLCHFCWVYDALMCSRFWLRFGGHTTGHVYMSHTVGVVLNEYLKERNELQCVVLPPDSGWRTAGWLWQQVCIWGWGSHICHHRSSEWAWIQVSSIRPCKGMISHTICVVYYSAPAVKISYCHNTLFN